jgi:hypothetical protein
VLIVGSTNWRRGEVWSKLDNVVVGLILASIENKWEPVYNSTLGILFFGTEATYWNQRSLHVNKRRTRSFRRRLGSLGETTPQRPQERNIPQVQTPLQDKAQATSMPKVPRTTTQTSWNSKASKGWTLQQQQRRRTQQTPYLSPEETRLQRSTCLQGCVDPTLRTSESRYRIRYPDRTTPPVIPQWWLARQQACTSGEYGCYNMPHTLSLFTHYTSSL